MSTWLNYILVRNLYPAAGLMRLESGIDYLLGFETIIKSWRDGLVFQDAVNEESWPNRLGGKQF